MKKLYLIFLAALPAMGFCQGPSSDTVHSKTLKQVEVTGWTLPVKRRPDKTIVNVEASVTNTGSTVLEVLERSPGVTVDRNGGITLNGKSGVLVMIDDKPTYLSGDDLNNLLSSMNSSQVSRIELITNPSAKYDAAGSAGIINIKTKKNKNEGLNGSVTASVGQGVYPKSVNSLVLNYRKGRVNTFLNYSFNDTKYLTELYAYRKYYDDNKNGTAILEQPGYFKGTVVNNTVKAGVDYTLDNATTVGVALTGADIQRKGRNSGPANWLRPDGSLDSSILTSSKPSNMFRNGAVNLNGKRVLSKSSEISADVDYLHYTMKGTQDFDNQQVAAGGYDEVYRAFIPTRIDIFSAKLDATTGLGGDVSLNSGFKTSSSHTDNAATYENWDGQQYVKDEPRSNHFVYQENIQAVYATLDGKHGDLSYQAGMRYEYTAYTAHQFGNSQQHDSAVSRNYGAFFPSGFLSYKLDSINTLTLTVGRRTDRPVFQTLNPFVYVINKYTYETGNPYLLPQYTWNFELNYQYGDLLSTGIAYTRVNDYFSQIFLSDSSKSILYYTQGNVGHVNNLGVTVSLSLSPVKWWSFMLTGVFNHKEFRGFNGNNYSSMINQLNVNLNNQLSFGKGYAGEVSGFYTTKARNDIQELLSPTGQLSAGMSKSVMKKKGTIKLTYRDILWTNVMEGNTSFPDATEYFKLKRDSRVLTLSFTFRFGNTYKVSRHQDGASEEKERVQNG
jgi:iron complex outermembrane receptor protein